MAKIQGISGSTKIILDGIKPINGKKPATLAEVTFFYDNYFAIYDERKGAAAKQQDQLIASLTEGETRLDHNILEDIAKRKNDRDAHITDLHLNIKNCNSFFRKAGYSIQYLFAKIMSIQSINASPELVKELQNMQDRKRKTITYRLFAIEESCKDLLDQRKFLDAKYSFLVGAQGEEQVIQALSGLPDEYHVLNDVNLDFRRDACFKKIQKYIDTCQIDHVVIGPTGLFLLETKNWQTLEREWKAEKLKHQVHRANNALRSYLKEKYGVIPWLQSLIISINGKHSGYKIDQYTEIIAPENLCDYITMRKKFLSDEKIDKIVQIIPRVEDKKRN
jgi:hypothetical protein